MKKEKFDEYDRIKVISEIEKHFHVKLSTIGDSKKYLKDNTGKKYIILGGYGNWHGIPKEIIKIEEEKSCNDSILIIAKKDRQNIDIYEGRLRPLIERKKQLTSTDKQYEFDIIVQGSKLRIQQIKDEFTLKILGKIFCPEKNKIFHNKYKELFCKIEALSSEDKNKLVNKLLEEF